MKDNIKKFLSTVNSKLEYPVVVASCGRSCSTLLTHYIAKSAAKINLKIGSYVASHGLVMYEWDIEDVEPKKGLVYKTHDYPPSRKSGKFQNVKFVYTYSDPYEIIPSLIRKENELGASWIRGHANRLKKSVSKVEEAYNNDVFGLEYNFDSWVNCGYLDVICLRRDCIWSEKEKIEEHIGTDIKLPSMRDRKSSIKNIKSKSAINSIKKTYKSMHKKVSQKCFVNNTY